MAHGGDHVSLRCIRHRRYDTLMTIELPRLVSHRRVPDINGLHRTKQLIPITSLDNAVATTTTYLVGAHSHYLRVSRVEGARRELPTTSGQLVYAPST